MEVVYKQKGNNYRSTISNPRYVGVDFIIVDLKSEFLIKFENIEYVGHCNFKGDILTATVKDDEHHCFERVIFFGMLE